MKKIIILFILMVFIPVMVAMNINIPTIYKYKYGIKSNKIIKVKRLSKNRIDEVPLEDYVIGVVAGEMPASFNNEALKAQAVVSRTYVLNKITKNNNKDYDVLDNSSNQVYIDEDDMKEKWKSDYERYKEKIKNAVTITTGQVILYKNEIIDAMFFSTSNGYTENSEDVFSNKKPYLVSVKSNWDEEISPAFSSMNTVSKTDFINALNIKENYIELGEVVKTKTGRIKTIVINEKKYDSNTIRNTFGLKSTSFEIKINDDNVIFNVKGYGHGVGMSQYGANGMAKNGSSYVDILKHYYKGVTIGDL